MGSSRLAPALAALVALAAAGCAGREIRLEPASAAAGSSGARVSVEDKRPDPGAPLGTGEDSFLRTGYDVETDGDLASWLEGFIAGALVAPLHDGRATGGREGALAIDLLRFDLRGSTWVEGVAVFDLTLKRTGAADARHRLTVRVSELMTDDGDVAWSQVAAKLARWSAIEIARWTQAASG